MEGETYRDLTPLSRGPQPIPNIYPSEVRKLKKFAEVAEVPNIYPSEVRKLKKLRKFGSSEVPKFGIYPLPKFGS